MCLFLEQIFSIFQNCEPTLTNILYFWANFHCSRWQIIQNNLAMGLFHKTLQIRKLQICSYGQILTINLLINCKNSVIYPHFAVNLPKEKILWNMSYCSRVGHAMLIDNCLIRPKDLSVQIRACNHDHLNHFHITIQRVRYMTV